MVFSKYARFLLAFFLLAAAAGCEAPGLPGFQAGSTPSQVVEALPTPPAGDALSSTPTTPPTPLAMLAPLPSPIPTQDCLTPGGTIQPGQVASALLPDPLDFLVYLPPCYAEESQRRYPVLYLLHGMDSTDDQWVRLGVGEAMNRLVAAGTIPPFLVVMPYDRDQIQQPTDDPFGEALVQDLVPFVDAHYRTLAGRSQRAVGGLSRGAAWALHLGLWHWQVFGAIGAHSLPIFHADAPLVPGQLAAIPAGELPRIYIDIGRSDAGLEDATNFESLLTQWNIPHEWHVFTGFHDEAYWSAHLEQYLEWYAQDW